MMSISEIPRLPGIPVWTLHDGWQAILQRTIPLVRDGAKTTLELADAVVFVLKQRPLELPEKVQPIIVPVP